MLETLSRTMGEWLDTERIAEAARGAPPAESVPQLHWPSAEAGAPVRIGYVRDTALWFYYEENIEALGRAGAEVVQLSLLENGSWPEIHGLYLGGGFPEMQAQALAENDRVREHVRRQAAQGMPIYAECGGLMYLGRSIRYAGSEFPMAGVFPFTTELCARPQGHGYTEVEVVEDNPFFPKGMVYPGHEFHYSRLLPGEEQRFVLRMRRGHGVSQHMDGLVVHNVFAAYTHIHALGVPEWAGRFVAAARRYQASTRGNAGPCPRLVAG